MTTKTRMYAEIAEQAARQVTESRENWTSFLTTAARLYKYPYHHQLMIHYQRPDATACAEYDFWNQRMGRYVKRGSKGIVLIDYEGDQPKLRYVFDLADTGERARSRPVNLWTMQQEYLEPIQTALEKICGVPADGYTMEMQLEEVAGKLGYALDNKVYKQNPDSFEGNVAKACEHIRIALTGRKDAPDLFTLITILGKDEVVKRLKDSIK